MKFNFLAIGKDHEPYVREGVEMFTNRISHYFPAVWKLYPAAKQKGTVQKVALKKAEAEQLLDFLDDDDIVVALDERGMQWKSEEVAGFIQQCANQSARNVVFLIGGPFGLDDSVLKRANHRWSLSKLVFPHQLVRLLLAEQVYRACTILKNEKYHHT